MMAQHVRIHSLAEWSRGASWRMGLQHSIPDHRLIWITRGQGLAVLQGQRRGVGVHNALIVPAGTLFSLDPGTQGYGQVCLIPANKRYPMPEDSDILRIRDTRVQADLNALLDTIAREQTAGRLFFDEALDAYGNLVTVWLRRTMIELTEEPPRKPAAVRLVHAYAALISRHFMSGRTMADYAAELGVTPTHLTRSCRDVAGLSAAQMLTQRILHAAHEMLEQPKPPLHQIAAILGFNSAAYFSRFIHQHTGHTPSALRKRALSRPDAGTLA